MDERHLKDIVALAEAWPIDWEVIQRDAHAADLEIPLAWLGIGLSNRGMAVPSAVRSLSPLARARLEISKELARARPGKGSRRRIVSLTLLSGKATALPRFLRRYVELRAADLRGRAVP